MSFIRKIFMPVAVFLLITVIFAVVTNYVQRRINAIKVSEKLTDTDPVDNAPPIVAFTTVALGSFRGIVADLLWLRTIALQDKGQYFEMVQLASWITKLQPRFTGATAYLAWNMAYNISVTFSSPEDRWRWVRRGIELIRDEALNYNPADPVLYKELGWIYQHKVGNIMDDANLYYKNQMAIELMEAFGGLEPEWEYLMAMPDNEEQFKKHFNEKAPVWKALKDSEINSLDALEKEFRSNGRLPVKFTEKLKDPAEIKFVESYLRKRLLKAKFKLDPAKVVQINNKYGKLDWRLPEAHAIYWATLGIEHQTTPEPDVSCERMISQSLADAFKAGRLLVFDKNNFKSLMLAPNFNILDAVKKEFEDVYERQKSKSFVAARENFMVDAIVNLYTFGKYKKAEEYLLVLRKDFPGNPRYLKNIDEFVLKEWIEDAKDGSMKQVMGLIDGMLYQSMNFLAFGDADIAAGFEKRAHAIYLYYEQSQSGSLKRVGLKPYMEIKMSIIQNCLTNFPKPVSDSLRASLEEQKVLNREDNTILKEK
ncbi:MAG TPA: hypothetical protein DCZ94_14950 [Lentisphaeria bacterium]|nr:MAG: hypothetical protein A2X48_03105 [Lentisphaerae bacterium GWF2_49_21]HBC88247.1 hypothetical protein [Lentisphaeria bacterium]